MGAEYYQYDDLCYSALYRVADMIDEPLGETHKRALAALRRELEKYLAEFKKSVRIKRINPLCIIIPADSCSKKDNKRSYKSPYVKPSASTPINLHDNDQ